MASASQSIVIGVSADDLYHVITDYERYPEFLPETEHVEILSRRKKGKEGARIVEVSYQIKVVKRFEYTLQMTEIPGESVRWEQVEGPFKVNSGGWSLEALGKDEVDATYDVTVEVGFLVPKSITNMLVGQSLPDTLRRFKQRAETIAAQKKTAKKKKSAAKKTAKKKSRKS